MPSPYPMPSFHFQVEWGGTSINFTRVRNLAMRNTIIESRKGASPEYQKTVQPGGAVFENFFLERPVHQADNEFYDWWKETALFNEGGNPGSAFRRDLTISLLDDSHTPVVVWKIKSAIPVRLSYSDLDAEGSSLMMEVLEISSEGIRVENN
ncbi:MAG: phage tail protein [Bacteroidota bacterium]